MAERNFGPALRGPIDIHRSGDGWVVRLQGETAKVKRDAQRDGFVHWSFAFHNQGYFQGQQETTEGAIEGHWFQPPGVVQGYPFATALRLDANGDDAFSGELVPFTQDVSLNILLTAEDSNPTGYRAFLRNPQRNLGVFFRIESATVEGDEIRFANRDGDVLGVASGAEPGARFKMLYPRFGETLNFTRRTRANAPGFYPRRWHETPSTLSRPNRSEDGWSTATPKETGLDEQPLRDLIDSLASFEPTGLRQPYIHGLLIAHRGKLVVEEYFHGFHRNQPHDSRSAGKSLTSALLGIAIHQGAIPSVNEPVYPMLGGIDAYPNPDARKAKITLRHLVTMSSGYACDDDDPSSPGNEDTMQSQDAEPDWYRYALGLPMAREPGEAGVYCTAGINLLGAALRKATSTSLPRFFDAAFARPLGIAHYHMNLSPTYRGYMGGGIRLRPRDFLKLGQLYLDGGVWRGQRLVSEAWVRDSFAAHASINETDDYGFGWWRKTYRVEGRDVATYYASGNGGQLLFVVPEQDLVVLIHAGNYSDGRTRNAFRDRFMQESILPAGLSSARVSGGRTLD
ncbi:MAG: serine hydrolase [Myxococcota bacterium]